MWRRKCSKLKDSAAFLVKILATVLTAALMVSVLVCQITLTEKSDELAAMETQLAELKEENRKLSIEYASSFSPDKLEDYAENELGLQPPNNEQTVCVDTDNEDKAVIPQK